MLFIRSKIFTFIVAVILFVVAISIAISAFVISIPYYNFIYWPLYVTWLTLLGISVTSIINDMTNIVIGEKLYENETYEIYENDGNITITYKGDKSIPLIGENLIPIWQRFAPRKLKRKIISEKL